MSRQRERPVISRYRRRIRLSSLSAKRMELSLDITDKGNVLTIALGIKP